MINKFQFNNVGPIQSIEADNLQGINLVIAENSKGKTYLLKMLYAIIRSYEESHKGKQIATYSELLRNKLFNIFQSDKIGDIVTKGEGSLEVQFYFDEGSGTDNQISFSFGSETAKQIKVKIAKEEARQANSIFLPPKEVLSLMDIIYQSSRDGLFGFDETYVDLINALKEPTKKGNNYRAFAKSRKGLEEMFAGKVTYNQKSKEWQYRKGNSIFSINLTSEGIKKVAMLDTLLGNRYLSDKSIIFIDEVESNLHPKAITQFLDILYQLSKSGVQIFIASHSYFVIKKLALIAQKENISIPVLIGQADGQWRQEDLKDGMPDNEIINESIRLFEEGLPIWEDD